MRLIVINIILLFFFSCSLEKKESKSSLLWRISGNGLVKPSFLLGSYHTVHYSFLDSINDFQNSFEKVEQVLVEKQEYNVLHNEILMEDYLMPIDTSYTDILNSDELILLDSILMRSLGINSSKMLLKPDFLSLFINKNGYNNYLSDISCESIYMYDCALDESMDVEIQRMAKRRKKKIFSLDSLMNRKDVYFFDNIPKLTISEGASLLMYTVYDSHSYYEKYIKLKSSYITQNIDDFRMQVNFFLNDTCINYLNPYANVIDSINKRNKFDTSFALSDFGSSRNVEWMNFIPFFILDKPSLIVVGVFHLYGNDGLICLLREKGFIVEPVIL